MENQKEIDEIIKRLGNKSINDLLISVTELIDIADKIKDRIPSKGSQYSLTKDFFLYHFLDGIEECAKSVVLLVDKGHLRGAILVARNALEGLFYLSRYTKDHCLAADWRDFAIYEDYRWEEKVKGRAAANDLLKKYRKDFGHDVVRQAEKKFKFQKKIDTQNWYRKGNIWELVMDNKMCKSLYDWVYFDLSKVDHWSPSGVIGTKTRVEGAIAVTFQCLYIACECVNKVYNGSSDDLQNVVNRYMQGLV